MMNRTTKGDAEEVVRIVAAADGELVGRTRLQKTAFLLELTGLGSGFHFAYKHYGPFSEELASAINIAPLLFDSFEEEQKRADWGGTYSVFSSRERYERKGGECGRGKDAYKLLVSITKEANPIVLELTATAAYLESIGENDPWGETKRRKPVKATNTSLKRAKRLYQRLKELPVPKPLSDI